LVISRVFPINYTLILHVNRVETHKLYIVSLLCRNCSNCLNLLCIRYRFAKLVRGNYVRTLKMIPGERFQFLHFIDEIVETPIVSLQVKKTQDGSVEGIYDLNTVIRSLKVSYYFEIWSQLFCSKSSQSFTTRKWGLKWQFFDKVMSEMTKLVVEVKTVVNLVTFLHLSQCPVK